MSLRMVAECDTCGHEEVVQSASNLPANWVVGIVFKMEIDRKNPGVSRVVQETLTFCSSSCASRALLMRGWAIMSKKEQGEFLDQLRRIKWLGEHMKDG